MSEYSATAEQIGKAGTRLFVITYGGKQEDSLNSLWYMEMVSSSKASLDPQKLPPYRKSSTLLQSTSSLTSFNVEETF